MNVETLQITDTRIMHVDLERRVMAGACVLFDNPGVGVSWDEKTRFTWHEAGTPVFLCHKGRGTLERVSLGAATLSRLEGGILAVVWLPRVMPDYAPPLYDIAQQPDQWGFSVELSDIVYADGTAHALSAYISAIGFTRWLCMSSSYCARNPGPTPPAYKPTAEVLAAASAHCCLIQRPGCWFVPRPLPTWAGGKA